MTTTRSGSRIVRWLDSRFYGSDYCDETCVFKEHIEPYLKQESIVLDAGCGRGLFAHDYKERVKLLVGCDATEQAWLNPYVHTGVVCDMQSIPFEDGYFDLIFSRWTAEHLADPVAVFREFARVLKAGGRIVMVTPNVHHYVALISRVSPHWLHLVVARFRGREEEDTFRTAYRANSQIALRRILDRTGLQLESIEMIETRPNYLDWSAPTFLFGFFYQRLVNQLSWLAALRIEIIFIARK